LAYLLDAIYLLLLLLLSPYFLVQAIRKGKYREGFAAKLLGSVPPRTSGGVCLWLHAVSVGEVNLLSPLLKEIARRQPGWQCVISTTTMTGMALARKKYPHLTAFYCPLDFSWAVRRAMRRIRPHVLVLAELELWPNLIRAAREQGAKVAVINGRLSEHSFSGYRRIRGFVGRMLRQIDLLAVQDSAYAQRFLALGATPETVHITGSMKYDGAQTERANPVTQRLRAMAGFADDDVVLLVGSTQEPEEQVAIDVFARLAPAWPKLRLVIVPRHPERFDAVARLLEQSGLAWQRRTRLEPEGVRPNARMLLVDCVGELGAWWGAAHIAFVGGSLGNRGGQNMIEPAAYGAAVSFGPNTRNFRDIVSAMLARDAAVVVADGPALEAFAARCLREPEYGRALGERARQLVFEQLGATSRTLQLLESLAAQPHQPA
jgi:3-deoxy-D-manno-octulosonic-acid transferase